MVEFKIESELDFMMSQLERIDPRQWPFVISKALNESGKIARDHLKTQIPRYIENPVPYTLSAVRYSRATRQRLESEIFWFKSGGRISGGRYLQPQAEGGSRPQKGFERALQSAGLLPRGWRVVPTPDIARDQFGNVPRSVYNSVIRVLGAMTDDARARAYAGVIKRKGIIAGIKDLSKEKRKPKLTRYFAIVPSSPGGLPPGIYERRSFGFGIGSRRVFSFVSGVNYTKRFPFEEILTRKTREVFPDELDSSLRLALATSRPGGAIP